MNAFLRLASVTTVLCLALAPAALRAAPLDVVTSFSILADFAHQVGGERIALTTLVGPDEDAHAYQARPSDSRKVLEADLVIANGLGFDTWLERLAQSAGHGGAVVIASDGIAPIEDAGGHAHHGHDHGATDPHAWQDVKNAKTYARNIAVALARADPAGDGTYRANLARYLAELDALDNEIRSALAALPDGRRKVVTPHDAFGYFAHAYDIEFIAAAGISNHAEVSAAGMARLIRQLRRENAPAVFIENVNDRRLIERIGSESGAHVGGLLYTDALSGADGPAPTYTAMMRHNLRMLMQGLAPTNE